MFKCFTNLFEKKINYLDEYNAKRKEWFDMAVYLLQQAGTTSLIIDNIEIKYVLEKTSTYSNLYTPVPTLTIFVDSVEITSMTIWPSWFCPIIESDGWAITQLNILEHPMNLLQEEYNRLQQA